MTLNGMEACAWFLQTHLTAYTSSLTKQKYILEPELEHFCRLNETSCAGLVVLVLVTQHGLSVDWHNPSFPHLLVSSTLQLKSVIRRTKETSNVHPMFREGMLRRKMGPIIVNKSNSQDRLIEELQGKLGIGRVERRRKQQPDDWMTEGVIVMSNPQRTREEGAHPSVDKVDIRGAQQGSVVVTAILGPH